MIELANIRKQYGNRVVLDLSFRFESGKIYVIKGVSGCGKTTLLNVLSGIDSNYEGEVIVFGKANADRTSLCGYVFQQSLLVKQLNVRDNLRLVCDNEYRIDEYCKKLGIVECLEKKPDQLSGGERQRVSIVRAVINDPPILLCDEPTASLDKRNSEIVSHLIAEQKREGRIIIVATHEPFFDGVADEVIDLSYGTISKDIKAELRSEKPFYDPGRYINKQGEVHYSAFRYAKQKNENLIRPFKAIPIILAAFLIMVFSTFVNSYQTETIRLMSNKWPMDLLVFSKTREENIPYLEELIWYDDYQIETSDIKALYLPEKGASVLSVEGLITYGDFPKNDNEILVTPEAFRILVESDMEPESAIGREVVFLERSFIISGIVDNSEEAMHTIDMDAYYRHEVQKAVIFIPYDTISRMSAAVIKPNELQEACYVDILSHPDALEAVLNYHGDALNPFASQVKDYAHSLETISILITVIYCIVVLIACLFLLFNILSELIYRKREFGFLQIFGVARKRIIRFVLAEYVIKLVVGIITAKFLYLIVIAGYRIVFGKWVFFNPVFVVAITIFMSFSYLGTAYLATRKFMKKGIYELAYT